MYTNKVIAVLGPTASGKTELTLNIAQKFNAVVINCDSRQLYSEMLIGTASPSDEEKKLAEHRLFNFLSPAVMYSAYDYSETAVKEIKKVWAENKLPILTGGTGFYYSSVAEGLGQAESNPDLAEALKQELYQKGLNTMIEKLKVLDPGAISIIDLNNPRRVLRALEIVISTKKPFAENTKKAPLPEADFFPIVVTRNRDELHKRIEKRIDFMFEAGLVDEAKNIIEKYGKDASALSSIGYRELIGYYDGSITLPQAKEQILFHTRQYAKRQETWFRKNPGVAMTNLDQPNCIDNILTSTSQFLKTHI